jgi:hypothetical protein
MHMTTDHIPTARAQVLKHLADLIADATPGEVTPAQHLADCRRTLDAMPPAHRAVCEDAIGYFIDCLKS